MSKVHKTELDKWASSLRPGAILEIESDYGSKRYYIATGTRDGVIDASYSAKGTGKLSDFLYGDEVDISKVTIHRHLPDFMGDLRYDERMVERRKAREDKASSVYRIETTYSDEFNPAETAEPGFHGYFPKDVAIQELFFLHGKLHNYASMELKDEGAHCRGDACLTVEFKDSILCIDLIPDNLNEKEREEKLGSRDALCDLFRDLVHTPLFKELVEAEKANELRSLEDSEPREEEEEIA